MIRGRRGAILDTTALSANLTLPQVSASSKSAQQNVLWTSRLDGSAATQIQLPGMRTAFPRFSPDNKLIVFTALRDGPANVYLVSAGGGTPKPVVPESSGDMRDPDWSPDGSHLVVDRGLAPTQLQPSSMLAFVDLKTSQMTNIPGSEELHTPRWSPDGRYIAAVRAPAGQDHSEIVVFDTRSQAWSTVAQGTNLSFPVWSADGADVAYQDAYAPGQPL